MLVTSRALAPDPARDDRIALRQGAVELSYRELRERASQVGEWSREWPGGADGAFVGLLGAWTPDFLASFLGLAVAGWAVGVLDPSWSREELDGALVQLAPSVVLIAEGSEPTDAMAGRGWRQRGLPRSGWAVWSRGGEPSQEPRAARAEGAFYVGFTSGSSGRPKAFVRSHRSWWESFEGLSGVCPIDLDGAVVIPGTLSSSHFLFGALHGLHAGATVELLDGERLRARLDRADPVSALYVVPTMLAQLAADPPATSAGPRSILCAGARLETPLRAETASRFPGSCLVEYYGASELSFVAIRIDGDGTPPGAVGRAFPGVEVSIRGAGDEPLPPGETGLIFARSPLVFSGYRGVAPATGARTIAGGWITVGDRGAIDADGYLSVAGRGSALIITGGANVQPEEVEEVIASHRGVAACVVVGVPDPTWGEVVCAVVSPRAGVDLRRADLRRHAAAVLTREKRPRRYFLLAEPPPLGRSGKVDRPAVRALALAGRLGELR